MKDNCDSTQAIMDWMCRDYESAEFWKSEARRFVLASLIDPNGEIDSERVRIDFAKYLGEIFSSFVPKSQDVLKWMEGHNTPQSVHIPTPTFEISEVDWECLADYFLFCVHETSSVIEKINSLRTEFTNKIKSRSDANINRMKEYHRIMQKFLGDTITYVNPWSQKDKEEFQKLQSRPVLIEEEKKKGELMEIALSCVTSYRSKYF